MSTFEIFDTHAHYDDHAFDEDREELIGSLKAAGVGRVVNIGSTVASCEACLTLAEKHDFIYAAIGVHPSETAELTEERFENLRRQCQHPKCLAVGEIGLDYYWPEPDAETQKLWFERQLELARELKKPVVIHSRDACRDTLEILKKQKAEEIGGVIHCYSYTRETAKEYLDMGFFFGIGGVLTFKNGKKLKETVEILPMERIVIETDSPYLAPVPNRGKRNDSRNLAYVVRELAQMKGMTEDEVRKVTWENACRLYRM
ncbi:MAG: TatD family hydrolase [Lachnospiraceae bacterium]|nr:TatD family hydrolase [Lachnospiraceae bacterium]